jgi:arylformamidase
VVAGGIAISGIFDLQPLVPTSINGALGLDLETAREASPKFWPPPPPGRALTAVVGAEESSEFLRQSREIVERWGAAGVETEYLEVPGTNHFTVVDELTRPRSSLFKRLVLAAGSGRERDLY